MTIGPRTNAIPIKPVSIILNPIEKESKVGLLVLIHTDILKTMKDSLK